MTIQPPTTGNDTGLPAITENHEITSLPFVRNATKAEVKARPKFPRIFWSVQPTGDYVADCETGKQYAIQALDYMTDKHFTPLLGWAVDDMIHLGRERSGIEVGFLSEIARHAIVGTMIKRMADERKAEG